ncbi:uncharacterized protein LOC128251791 [Drosophila gunungcola]|uniref:uncharacterized protein LOC128251791 n=1 Tax=Drosophila gunungcola TaxID=103775 RepID=UPI0022E81912|nr:uncharacterized protein LOC128251791 [Drosophila gunungcola]XP_052834938.1 uncharacterized protein LOC128251791 [Drosophila gunungcola]
MDTKNIQNKPMNGEKFLEMLSTISLEEILQFEFRLNPTKKWELLVTPTDPRWKYNCNICRVVQFGDKNLFSHLSGKKHNAVMVAEQQLQIRLKPAGGPQKAVTAPLKRGPNTNMNNNKNSPSPVVKNSPASNKNLPNKNDGTNATVKQAGGNLAVKAQPTPKNSPAAGANTQKKPNPSAVQQAQKNTTGNNTAPQKNIQGNITPNQKNNQGNITPNQKNIPGTATPTPKNIPGTINSPAQKTFPGKNPTIQKNIPVIGATAQKNPNVIKGNIQANKTVGNVASPKNPGLKNGQQAATTPNSTSPSNISKNLASPAAKANAVAMPMTKPVQNSQPKAKIQPETQTQPKTKPPPVKTVQNAKTNNVDNKINNPDIVKNPLSTKISCVPLAKLICSTPEPEADSDVIIIDEQPKEQPREQPKEVSKPPETPKNIIPIQTTKPTNVVAKKSTKNVAPPVRPSINKVITPSYVAAPKDFAPARSGNGTFESRSQSHVMGLVGVEYVLKIVRNLSDKNARYQCCLCEITADEQSMHNHLLGYNHRLKYFDKHFPTAMRQYRQYVSHVPEGEVCKIMMPVFDKLAMAIETHHGRKTAHLCYEHVYAKDRQELFSQVYNRKHSSEKMGPSFTHVVNAEEVDELIEKARNNVALMNIENPNPYFMPSPYAPPQGPSNYMGGYQNAPAKNPSQTVDDETHKRMVENFLRDTRQNSGEVQKSRNLKRNRSRSKSPDQRKRVAPKQRHWNVERRSVSPLRDGDLWQAYRHMVDLKVRELNVSFDQYKSDPEQHPSYQTEWQMFWKRRKDELIQAGINHRSYNFQNEWIHFFNARIEELYNQDIENIKIKCRERLCLPMTNNELANEKYHVHLPKTNEPPAMRKPEATAKGPEKMSVDVVEPPNVIHVLRLLTALENYLGSLGPFITEMLVKALQTQKIYPEKVHFLILTAENCAILETVKEKFTGLLISQIYDPAKERALKKAINDTELLLQEASKYNHPKQSVENPALPMANKNQYNVEKPLDKTELAAKLASSLVSQGKTSINREELQKILQVYTLIEQKKRQDVPSTSSVNSVPSTCNNLAPPNSNNNVNLLTQHSTRNLNNASNGNSNANNATSMYTGPNYSGNVARFNNQQNSNNPNTLNAYPTDRGFGSSGSGLAGGYQNNQFGSSGASTMNPSSVLRHDLTTSSLFNFNTNLNPAYNNLNRRNNY